MRRAPRRRPPRHLACGTTWRLQSTMQNTVAEMSLNSNHVQRRPRIIRNERRHRQFGMHSILSSTVNSRPKGSKSSCVPCKVGAGDELRDVGRWAASSTGTQTATGRPASFFLRPVPTHMYITPSYHRAGIITVKTESAGCVGQHRAWFALVQTDRTRPARPPSRAGGRWACAADGARPRRASRPRATARERKPLTRRTYILRAYPVRA